MTFPGRPPPKELTSSAGISGGGRSQSADVQGRVRRRHGRKNTEKKPADQEKRAVLRREALFVGWLNSGIRSPATEWTGLGYRRVDRHIRRILSSNVKRLIPPVPAASYSGIPF